MLVAVVSDTVWHHCLSGEHVEERQQQHLT